MKYKSITVSDLLLQRGMYNILEVNEVNLNEVLNLIIIFENVKSFLVIKEDKIIITLNNSCNEEKQIKDLIILLRNYFKQNGKN